MLFTTERTQKLIELKQDGNDVSVLVDGWEVFRFGAAEEVLIIREDILAKHKIKIQEKPKGDE